MSVGLPSFSRFPYLFRISFTCSTHAKSFARIFYRNAINIGLPILEADLEGSVSEGDELEIDVVEGVIENKTKGLKIEAKPLPPLALEIIKAGGLTKYVRKKLGLE